jgi:hypothetical protein
MSELSSFLHDCAECVHCRFPASRLIFCPIDNKYHHKNWGRFCNAFRPALVILAETRAAAEPVPAGPVLVTRDLCPMGGTF